MALIIGASIRRKEFGKTISEADRAVLIRSARIELAKPIKGDALPKGTRLLKVYATSVQGARRIVLLLDVPSGDCFLLFYRSKKDQIGANITLENKVFKVQLRKQLAALLNDIESGDYETIEL